jgi:hypothetical protein
VADLVQSVRADFNEPALPFIISGPGMDGYRSRGKANICNAQRRAADRPELNESVIYVESRIFAAKYACLDMNDTVCEGLSDAGCDGSDNSGCACQDIIDALKKLNPDYKRQCNFKVELPQPWIWNARSYFKVGQKMGEVTLTLTPALYSPLSLSLSLSLILGGSAALWPGGLAVAIAAPVAAAAVAAVAADIAAAAAIAAAATAPVVFAAAAAVAAALAQPAAAAMGRGRSRALRAHGRLVCRGRPAFDQRGLLQVCRVLQDYGRRATHGHFPGDPQRPGGFLRVRRRRRALHAKKHRKSGLYELV